MRFQNKGIQENSPSPQKQSSARRNEEFNNQAFSKQGSGHFGCRFPPLLAIALPSPKKALDITATEVYTNVGYNAWAPTGTRSAFLNLWPKRYWAELAKWQGEAMGRSGDLEQLFVITVTYLIGALRAPSPPAPLPQGREERVAIEVQHSPPWGRGWRVAPSEGERICDRTYEKLYLARAPKK